MQAIFSDINNEIIDFSFILTAMQNILLLFTYICVNHYIQFI